MNTVLSISFPCRKAFLTSILLSVKPFEAIIAKAMRTLSRKQVGESVWESYIS